MINFQFDPSKVTEVSFEPIPAGKHRIRIESCESTESVNHNPMVKMVFAVSGYNQKLFHNLVLTQEYGNSKLAQLWESFNIPSGTLDESKWVGKVGACLTKVENDVKYGEKTVVSYFLNQKQQQQLPPWKEPNTGKTATASGAPFSTDDLPDGLL